MATPDGMHDVSPSDSWDLRRYCARELGGVGRIAVAIMNHPDIFPVNYAVDDTGETPSVVIKVRPPRSTRSPRSAVAASPWYPTRSMPPEVTERSL